MTLKLGDLELIVLPIEVHNAKSERAWLKLNMDLVLWVRLNVLIAI